MWNNDPDVRGYSYVSEISRYDGTEKSAKKKRNEGIKRVVTNNKKRIQKNIWLNTV